MVGLKMIMALTVWLSLFLPVPALADEQVVVRICYPNKAQYAPFILAKEADAWKKSGLQVKDIVLSGGGIDAAEALIAKEADMAAMGDVPALIVLSRNDKFHILSSYMTSEGMHRIVVAGTSGIRTPADLKGKKLAVQVGTSTHGALLLYLQKQGIDKKDVTWVSLPPQHFPEAMQMGEVDAIAGSEPWPQNVLDKNPSATQLTDLSGLGNSYPHVLLVRNDFLQAHPQEVKVVLQVLASSEVTLREKPEEAARVIARSTGRDWQKEFAANAEMHWELTLDQSIEKSLCQTAEFLFAEGKLKKIPDIKKAMQASVTYP